MSRDTKNSSSNYSPCRKLVQVQLVHHTSKHGGKFSDINSDSRLWYQIDRITMDICWITSSPASNLIYIKKRETQSYWTWRTTKSLPHKYCFDSFLGLELDGLYWSYLIFSLHFLGNQKVRKNWGKKIKRDKIDYKLEMTTNWSYLIFSLHFFQVCISKRDKIDYKLEMTKPNWLLYINYYPKNSILV